MKKYGNEIKIRVLVVGNRKDEPYKEFAQKALRDFRCGNEKIDDSIFNDLSDHKTVSYLFVDDETDKVFAYASLACSEYVGLLEDDEPLFVEEDEEEGIGSQIINLAPSDGTTPHSEVKSAIEIKFFATDEDYHGLPFREASSFEETLSMGIFSYIFEEIRWIAENYIGAETVVLNAVPQAINFYKKCYMKLIDSAQMRMHQRENELSCIPMYRPIFS